MTSARDPLRDPKLKIQRGKSHIGDLERAIKAFFDTEPCSLVTERYPNSGEVVYKLSWNSPIPTDIETVAGDVVHNIRSSLDLPSCCLARQNGHADVSGTYFPFGK